jgi:hypothetical protein
VFTTDPVTPSVPRVTLVHRLFTTSNLYTVRVQHAGVTYLVEAEAERSDAKLVGLYVEPIPAFDSIPAVLHKAGRAMYVRAVQAYTSGDLSTHRLLIGVSGSVALYASGLRRAMEDAA